MKYLTLFVFGFHLALSGSTTSVALAQSRYAISSDSIGMAADSLSGNVDAFGREPVVLFQPKIPWPMDIPPTSAPVKVWCKVKVDTSGIVQQVWILKSQTQAFEKPAKQLARQYRFQPAVVGGRKQDCFIIIPILFKKTGH